jgi:type 2 lantibiotic biosynthesis protein LanM
MDGFYERLVVRAATIDELLSDEFEALSGQKGDADIAGRRLAAWCRSCSSGDWLLFNQRLDRDRLSIAQALSRFATVRCKSTTAPPLWIEDAVWIEASLQSPNKNVRPVTEPHRAEPHAFEHLFAPLIEQAEVRLWASIDADAAHNLNESARACLRILLLDGLSGLCVPAIFERFVKARRARGTLADAAEPQSGGTTLHYDWFVADMKAGGFRHLFEEKPILLRLIATITRQWIESARAFISRLNADLVAVRGELLDTRADSQVTEIEGGLSDPHNGGHSVLIVRFEDGARVVYKPKDLHLDAAWHALLERLNRGGAPIELRAVRVLARDGYGWTEFIEHSGCADAEGCKRFFHRAGAWLALFYCFAGADMHQENMIAAGEHPVPIDLEMILQASAEERQTDAIEAQAFEAAIKNVNNSVLMVGLLPAYGRSPENKIFAVGGMILDSTSKTKFVWKRMNSDTMRPVKEKEVRKAFPNLPHIGGHYAKFGDHIDDFVSGFEDYAIFLSSYSKGPRQGALFDSFAGARVRKVVHHTRFYYMLLQRLRDHRSMDDGVIWSAQADFVARLADWEEEDDPMWSLRRAERSALLALNVPYFVSASDGSDIRDAAAVLVYTSAPSGMDCASARVEALDEQVIARQVEIIRQHTSALSTSTGPVAVRTELKQIRPQDAAALPTKETFIAEADSIAAELSHRAIRRGSSAAWIGLDWLGDSEVSQLVVLGPHLYNGLGGIGVFLAAHARVTGRKSSQELALAAVSHLRKDLSSRNSARLARSLGIGGAVGLGSIVYALATMSSLLNDDTLLGDALVGAVLFTDELIAADKQLDVMSGSAGGILGLLRLYRDSRAADVLRRAERCGEHLLSQPRLGPAGRRSWIGQGLGPRPLNGMSHGAAGFAYALAELAAATGRQEFATAASECIAFENSSFDQERSNWPDLLDEEAGPYWPSQWCHGAAGIGLARIATAKGAMLDSELLLADVRKALGGVEKGGSRAVDTLCCGTMGVIEFLWQASSALGRADLDDLASRRLAAAIQTAASTGDYRWGAGKKEFNLGLFRGLTGVSYTCLRQVDRSLPSVLIWE